MYTATGEVTDGGAAISVAPRPYMSVLANLRSKGQRSRSLVSGTCSLYNVSD